MLWLAKSVTSTTRTSPWIFTYLRTKSDHFGFGYYATGSWLLSSCTCTNSRFPRNILRWCIVRRSLHSSADKPFVWDWWGGGGKLFGSRDDRQSTAAFEQRTSVSIWVIENKKKHTNRGLKKDAGSRWVIWLTVQPVTAVHGWRCNWPSLHRVCGPV